MVNRDAGNRRKILQAGRRYVVKPGLYRGSCHSPMRDPLKAAVATAANKLASVPRHAIDLPLAGEHSGRMRVVAAGDGEASLGGITGTAQLQKQPPRTPRVQRPLMIGNVQGEQGKPAA